MQGNFMCKNTYLYNKGVRPTKNEPQQGISYLERGTEERRGEREREREGGVQEREREGGGIFKVRLG